MDDERLFDKRLYLFNGAVILHGLIRHNNIQRTEPFIYPCTCPGDDHFRQPKSRHHILIRPDPVYLPDAGAVENKLSPIDCPHKILPVWIGNTFAIFDAKVTQRRVELPLRRDTYTDHD